MRIHFAFGYLGFVTELIQRVADAVRRRSSQRNAGRAAAELAHRFLQHHGCTVVDQNFQARSTPVGIDLVACQGGMVVFVEVKAQTEGKGKSPDREVDAEKRRALVRAGREYACRRGVEWSKTRFDVVSVMVGSPARVEWLRDAFR